MPNIFQRSASKDVVFPKSPEFSLSLMTAELTQKEASHDILTLTYKGSMKATMKRAVSPNDPVEFTWSYGKTKGTFIGFVHTIEKKNMPSNVYTTIVCINNSGIMKNSRKKVYKSRTASQIVKDIATRYRFTSHIEESNKKYKRLSQSGYTDWQLLRQMAKATGFALRSENTSLMFRSRDSIIASKFKTRSVPAFLHLNRAPRGMSSQQTLISFTALDGQDTPEYGAGDSGVVLFDRDGTSYEFDSGYNITNGRGPAITITSPYDWQSTLAVTTQDMVDNMLTPTADTYRPANAYDITSYGAATSSEDNLTAIQDALNAAGAAAGVGNIKYVYIPEGTWNIKTYGTTRLQMKSYVYLKSHPNAVISNVGYSHCLVTTSSYTKTVYNGIKNATIDGGTWECYLTASGMSFPHADTLIIKNLTIKDTAGNGHAIEITSSTNVTIDNCRFVGIKKISTGERSGLAPRDWDEAIQIDYAWSGSTPYSGTDGTPCNGVTIQNCYFGPSGTDGSTNYPRAIGANQAKADSSRHSNINILNNTIVGCTGISGGAIQVYNMQSVVVQGNTISKTYRAINAYITNDNNTCISGLTGIQIKDNVIDNCGNWQKHASSPKNNYHAIELNVNDSASGNPKFNTVVITGNIITNHHGNTNYAIRATECSTITVQGNTVPNRHCGTTPSSMISVPASNSTVTVSKNIPDNE